MELIVEAVNLQKWFEFLTAAFRYLCRHIFVSGTVAPHGDGSVRHRNITRSYYAYDAARISAKAQLVS